MAPRTLLLLLTLLAARAAVLAQVPPAAPSLAPIHQDPWPSSELLLALVGLMALLLLLGCAWPSRRRTFRRSPRR